MEVYPNPARDQFTVKSPENSTTGITIFDSNGREVYSNGFIERIQIGISEIAGSGIMLIKLITDTNTCYEKIIIG